MSKLPVKYMYVVEKVEEYPTKYVRDIIGVFKTREKASNYIKTLSESNSIWYNIHKTIKRK